MASMETEVYLSNDRMFEIRELTPADLEAAMCLQQLCINQLPDARLYYPLSGDEFTESLRFDRVIGAFCDDELAAVAVIVVNRPGPRNLACELGLTAEDTFTFDAVMVHPGWRGYGLQRVLLMKCIDIARGCHVRHILATVSPDNSHSLNNFTRLGFEILATSEKYGGLPRRILNFSVQGKE